MTIWILYHQVDAQRNKASIGFYQEACRRQGLAMRLLLSENFGIGADGTFYEGIECLERPDAVINRTREYALARAFEMAGVRVFNKPEAVLLGNNKFLALQFVQGLGVPIMESRAGCVDCNNTIDSINSSDWRYPYVIKSEAGHGGTEVFLVHDDVEREAAERTLQGKEFLYQKAASDLGEDLRVYILGGEVYAACLRRSVKDFRSNYCLGGEASLYTLGAEELQMVRKITDALPLDYAGIDFIRDRGRFVFNEIEDVVGARMLYSLTERDVCGDYIDYVAAKCRRV